jgi:hypothetical protein
VLALFKWGGWLTYSLLVIIINLATETFLIVDLVLEGESVVLEPITGLDALLGCLVLVGVLFRLLDHTVDFLLSKTSLIVGDGDRLLVTSALVGGGDLQDSVGVKFERDLDLRNTTGSGRNVGQFELSEVVVAAYC